MKYLLAIALLFTALQANASEPLEVICKAKVGGYLIVAKNRCPMGYTLIGHR